MARQRVMAGPSHRRHNVTVLKDSGQEIISRATKSRSRVVIERVLSVLLALVLASVIGLLIFGFTGKRECTLPFGAGEFHVATTPDDGEVLKDLHSLLRDNAGGDYRGAVYRFGNAGIWVWWGRKSPSNPAR
jgi:hypothetical protein